CLGGRPPADARKRSERTAAIDSLEDDSSTSDEVDDDGRVYKNPRRLPSTLCPRDEDEAALLVRTVPQYTTREFWHCSLCISGRAVECGGRKSKKTRRFEIKGETVGYVLYLRKTIY
ncbi:hypothetical protein Cfor_00031, partial [Coptotermes formosanus]